MTQVLIRNVEPDVVERLRSRAQQNGRSLEAELRRILAEAASEGDVLLGQVERVRALFAGRTFGDSAMLLREDRDR